MLPGCAAYISVSKLTKVEVSKLINELTLPYSHGVLLNSEQEFIDIETWLLQLKFHCRILRVQIFEKGDSSNSRKLTVAPHSKFYGKV